jgi:hypothetical protein
MTDRDRRRALREQARSNPPDAGVIAIRHRATDRVAVIEVLNLPGARNRFDFARNTGTPGALPDPGLVADARTHGMDALELEILEIVPVDAGSDPDRVREDLAVLAALWRERLTGPGTDRPGAGRASTQSVAGVDTVTLGS